MRMVLACLALLLGSAHAVSAQSLLEAMAAAVGPADTRAAIAGLATRADGTGPRGAFTTEIVSLDDTVRFVQVRKGADASQAAPGSGQTALLVAGATAFTREAASSPMHATSGPEAAIVRGHDLHRLLLDLEAQVRVTAEHTDTGCVEGTTAAGRIELCPSHGDARPVRLRLTPPGAPEPIVVELSDWRPVLGVAAASRASRRPVILPFAIDYLQGGGRYAHRFAALMPFSLAPGVAVPADPGAAFDRLGDLAGLAALHRAAIEAHLASDVARLAAGEFARSTVARRGELVETTREALVGRLGPYLQSIQFARYEDVRVPVIAVSDDGSLGWIACEIEAEGHEVVPQAPGARVAYAFSWIETAVKRDGRWLRNGNASSARP